MVNKKFEQQNEVDDRMQQINHTISSVSSVLDQAQMCLLMERRAQFRRDQMIIGMMYASHQSNLILDTEDEGEATSNEESLSTEEITPDDWESNINLDEAFDAGVDVNRAGESDVKDLSKVWQITYKDAKHTLTVTTQHSICTQDPTLSQNYGANDQMLQYKWIREYFFMDTFFAMSKGGKSSRGNSCCQRFVIDKGLFMWSLGRESLKFYRL